MSMAEIIGLAKSMSVTRFREAILGKGGQPQKLSGLVGSTTTFMGRTLGNHATKILGVLGSMSVWLARYIPSKLNGE